MSKKRKKEKAVVEANASEASASDVETTNKVPMPERPDADHADAEAELLQETPTRFADAHLEGAAAELDEEQPTRTGGALEARDAIAELDEDVETRSVPRIGPADESASDADGEPSFEDRFDFGSDSRQLQALQDEPPDPGSADAASPRLQSIVESLLFAADRPLNLRQLADLVEEPEVERIRAAVLAVEQSWRERGVQLHEVAGGYQFRTNASNAMWVQKLLQQKPVRLSRALLETLAIVSYRQPITRPEIDDIRGVDSGGTLKTLMDRALVRILGKKEEVGRPLLYGTTKEFLEFFSLRDLKDLPTLREYHELSEEHQAQVAALEGVAPEGTVVPAGEEDDADELTEALPRLSRLEISQPKEDAAELEEIDRLIRTAGASIPTDSDLASGEEVERATTTKFAAVREPVDAGAEAREFEDDDRARTGTFGEPLPSVDSVAEPPNDFEQEEATRLRNDGLDAELVDNRDPDKEPA